MTTSSTTVEPSSWKKLPISRDSWLLVALMFYGVAAFFGPPDAPGLHLATVAALLGLASAVACLMSPRGSSELTLIPSLLGVGCFLAIRIAGPFVTADLSPTIRLLTTFGIPLILGCLGSLLLTLQGSRWWSAAFLSGSMAVCGALLVVGFQVPFIDVLLAHDAAAVVVAQGGSPYSANLEVVDTSPYSPSGRTIVGYPYPPVTAAGYVLGVWVFGDPRWLSVLALSVIAFFLVLALDLEDVQRRPASLLFASLPGIPIVTFLGWTEPLTLFLLTVCVVLWDKRPWWSAVLGGLALASKQYMLAVAPLLLIFAYRRDPKRATVMALAGAATLVPSLVLGWNDLLRSLVTNLAELEIRPDGSSLQGLLLNLGAGLRIPLIVSLVIPLVVALLLAGRVQNRRDLATSTCVVLTTFFLLGRQAFVNYWFLVAGLAVVAYALPDDEEGLSVGANLAG